MKTNYYVEIDSDLCVGCGICIERYQMGALTLVDDTSTVNLKKCLGCDLCVVICSSEAIKLKNKEKQTSPPETIDDLNKMILNKKNELIEKYVKSKN